MQRREAFLANFDTWRANNGGTEAMNGLIQLHSRIAAAFATATTTDYAWCSPYARIFDESTRPLDALI
jgi:hypothetical protein